MILPYNYVFEVLKKLFIFYFKRKEHIERILFYSLLTINEKNMELFFKLRRFYYEF